ncbi:MAG: hypothetical protein HC915_19650, partial [Anaerolineae bacterium]|nr:hypothetical protein [Anaerolineae bacterium]
PLFCGPWANGLLILDSDIPMVSPPAELLQQAADYQQPLFQQGRGEAVYHLPNGERFSSNLCTGILLFEKHHLHLPTIERYFGKVDETYRWTDQEIYIQALSQHRPVARLPADTYPLSGPVGPETICKHYTSPKREQLWLEGVHLLKNTLLPS